MPRFTLDRRAVLRGAGGTALALPFLEIMEGKTASAAVAPRRYLVWYAGISLTGDGLGSRPHFWTPTREGRGYDLGRDLAPLGSADIKNSVRTIKGHDVQEQVSVVSGLRIPWANVDGADATKENLPPGGKPANFHGRTNACSLAGKQSLYGDNPGAATSDQIVASEPLFTQGTSFPSLGLSIQGAGYTFKTGEEVGTISYKSGGRAISLQRSPHAAFDSLIKLVNPAGSGPTVGAANFEQDISVLDRVLERYKRLKTRLGAADRQRLDAHVDFVDGIERRLKTTPTSSSPACRKPAAAPVDPGEVLTAKTETCAPGSTAGWGDEDARGRIMRDLLYMALVCDLTRVAAVQISERQNSLNTEPICGFLRTVMTVHGGLHGLPDETRCRDICAWHLEHFAAFVRMLMDTDDIDGNKMIDNTVLVMGTEGGSGVSSEDGTMSVSGHSSEFMSMLVAGGQSLGLHPGQHINMRNGPRSHPAAVYRTAMRAVGVDKPLGDINDIIPGL